MIKFDILNRFSGAVQFTAEIECADDAPRSLKLGLAVKWAIKTKANLSEADLSRANLPEADLSRANLPRANLSWADLSRANLSGMDLSGANLSEADLSEANLSRANLSWADLSRADLSWADLSRANLPEADLSGANLSRANLSGADLSEADLSRANLSRADLSGMDLSGMDLSRADIRVIGGRSDGYIFILHKHADGALYLRAGCRYFTLADAREHWIATRAGTSLGAESMALIAHAEAMARIAGWLDASAASEAAA
jgi:hypothetical protein